MHYIFIQTQKQLLFWNVGQQRFLPNPLHASTFPNRMTAYKELNNLRKKVQSINEENTLSAKVGDTYYETSRAFIGVEQYVEA